MAVAHPESKLAADQALEEPDEPDVPGALEGGKLVRAVVRPSGVNSAGASSSNSKETRAREAEEDRALIAKAQSGDTAAFRSLVERHQRRAFAIAYSLVRDENDARELVQDAFLRVFKGLATFQNNSSFFTWLYRIVTNLSIDLKRKPGRSAGGGLGLLGDVEENVDGGADQESEFPLVSRIDGADPVDVLRRREIGARIQAALDALPPYHRSVIVMREVEGLSYDEMASVMMVSKGTIMSRLFHARQKLQRALHDCYAEQVGALKGGAKASETASPEETPEETREPGAEEAASDHDGAAGSSGGGAP